MFTAAVLFLIAKNNPNVHQQMKGYTKCDKMSINRIQLQPLKKTKKQKKKAYQ